VIDDAYNLKGLITVKDIQKSSDHSAAHDCAQCFGTHALT